MRHPAIPLTRRWRYRLRTGWVVPLVAGALCAVVVADVVADAQATEARYGERVTAAVARHDLAPGHRIDDGDLAWHDWPQAMLPAGAPVGDAVGRVVALPVLAGEPLAEGRLAPAGGDGPFALVPEDARVLAVPTGSTPVPMQVGDRVDLLDLDRWVARDATVVEVTDEAIAVAVDEDEAPAVARALVDGVITPARVAPVGRR